MALIEIRKLAVTRGKQQVIKDLSLDVKEGTITAIVGANGSGKSTLIGAIAGDHRLDAGSISIRGKDLTEISLAEQSVNVRSFTSSAYNHSVRVQVWNPAGFIEFEKSYKTSTKPTYTAQFHVGSRLRVEFKSDKGPHSQLFYSQGSEWVRHGNFCNGGSAQ